MNCENTRTTSCTIWTTRKTAGSQRSMYKACSSIVITCSRSRHLCYSAISQTRSLNSGRARNIASNVGLHENSSGSAQPSGLRPPPVGYLARWANKCRSVIHNFVTKINKVGVSIQLLNLRGHQLPSGHYKFVRKNNSIEGFMSRNRSSTDALNALHIWSNAQPQRSFTILVDEDEQLLANLSWSDADTSAGTNLEAACDKCGVECSYVPT